MWRKGFCFRILGQSLAHWLPRQGKDWRGYVLFGIIYKSARNKNIDKDAEWSSKSVNTQIEYYPQLTLQFKVCIGGASHNENISFLRKHNNP